PDRGAVARIDPDAWQRRAPGRVSCSAAQRRIGRTNIWTWQRRQDFAGAIRASRPTLLLLELARLPARLLQFLGLAVVLFGHEASFSYGGSGKVCWRTL